MAKIIYNSMYIYTWLLKFHSTSRVLAIIYNNYIYFENLSIAILLIIVNMIYTQEN